MNGVEGNDIEIRVMSGISGHGNRCPAHDGFGRLHDRRQITEKLNKLFEKLS